MSKSKFTGKQWLFINHYLSNGFNGIRAAESANYAGDYATLSSVAYENLKKPHIKAEIERRMKELAMPPDEVMARISDHGRGDIRELIGLSTEELIAHPKGNLIKKYKRRAKVLPSGHIIQEQVELELYSAETALNTLARHHGLLKDGITININIELVVEAIQALEAAGRDPAATFERLIQRAREEAEQRNA